MTIELTRSSADLVSRASPERSGPRGLAGTSFTLWLAPILIMLAAVAALTACEPGDQPGPEYMPDMARGPAYKAFMPNEATASGITLQRPVAGTIKRGFKPFHYGKGDAEAVRAGLELTNPFHPTEATLTKGKALYEIYCLVCHGEQGKGDGPISTKIPPPPSYKSERLLTYPPGRIFHVVTMGANKMPSYAVQLAPEDRWLVITYVRSQLQGLPEATPGSGEGSTLPASPPDEEHAPVPTPTAPGAGGTAGSAAPAAGSAAAAPAPTAAKPAAPAPAAATPPPAPTPAATPAPAAPAAGSGGHS